MSPKAEKSATPPLAGAVKDSAQQIWQAGLGAFARAQEEGSKAFDVLVKEGINIQRKTQAAAEEKLADATSKMSTLASGLSSKASGQWGKLETIFEDRVAKALHQLGVPSASDVAGIHARLDEIQAMLEKLAGTAPKPSAKKAAAKAPAKRSTKASATRSK